MSAAVSESAGRVTTADVSAFVVDLALDTKAHIAAQVAPLLATMAALQADVQALREQLGQVKDGTPGRDGKDADPLQMKALVAEHMSAATVQLSAIVREQVAAIPVPQHGEPGRDGKDVDVAMVMALVDASVTKAMDTAVDRVVARIPVPRDGKDADLAVIQAEVAAALAAREPAIISQLATKALSAIEKPRDGIDGTSVTVDEVRPLIDSAVTKAVEAIAPRVPVDVADLIDRSVAQAVKTISIEPGKDGTSVTVADVEPLIVATIETKMAALPRPTNGVDGTSVTVADVEPLIHDLVTKAVAATPPIGIADALLNHDGHLIVTLTNGQTRDVGSVMGRDADMALLQKQVADFLATIPLPAPGKDGRDGIDGKDGLGFEDADLVFTEQQGWILRLARDGHVKDLRLPTPWDAGPWRAGTKYPKGAEVIRRNSRWSARTDTYAEPGDGNPDWRLVMKRPEWRS